VTVDIIRIIAFKRLLGPVSVAFAISLCGCSRYDFVGQWQGNRNLRTSKGENNRVLQTMGRIELDIHTGGRFDMFEGGYPKDGLVSYRGGKAYLNVRQVMGQPIEKLGSSAVKMNKEMVLTPVDSNHISIWDPSGFDEKPLVLTRILQPSSDASRKN
jgi:hypothetical protein